MTEHWLGRGTSFTDYSTRAAFFDSKRGPVLPKDAKLNGISIPASGSTRFTNGAQLFGITHRWQIIANLSGTVPAIDDSVQAPNVFHVTFPRPNLDTISKSVGFTCTYGNPGTDSVTVVIYYDSVETVALFDSSIHHSRLAPISVSVPNTGSYSVSSVLLASLPNSGVIQVWVIADRSKTITISGRKYLIASVSRARTFSFIKS